MRIESRARRYRLPRLPDWLRAVLTEAPALPSQLLGVAVLLVMVASEAGYGDTNWPPAALLMLGLLAVTGVVVGLPRRPGALQLAGLALFGGYAAWSFLSITWAGVTADAWEAGNTDERLSRRGRALPALAGRRARRASCFSRSSRWGWRRSASSSCCGPTPPRRPAAFFIDVRFAEPAGYINANVAMWTVGLFGCAATAAFPRTHPALRGAALGGATLLAGLALLGQSRGWVFALPLALLVLLVISPDRLRIALWVDPHRRRAAADPPDAAGRPRRVQRGPPRRPAVRRHRGPDARDGDRRRRGRAAGPSPSDARHPTRPHAGGSPLSPGALLVALALGAAVVALAAMDDPTGKLSDTWTEFKQGYSDEPPSESESRFASAGSNRYDFWTVAWHGFEDEPVRGLGARTSSVST